MSCKKQLSTINIPSIRDQTTLVIKNQKKTEIIKTNRISPGRNNVYIPFSLSQKNGWSLPERKWFNPLNLKFIGELREEQKKVKTEAVEILMKNKCVIISCFTGFGKTIGAIDMACKINIKTLIVVNKIILINQWKQSIEKFCPDAKIHILKGKDEPSEFAHFSIINAQNIPKTNKTLLESFGLVVVDEAHLILSKKTFKCLLHLTPRYLIALSATPYRPDDLNKLFIPFFGVDMVLRKLNRKHIIYKVNTEFCPEIRDQLLKNKNNTYSSNYGSLKKTGMIDWNHVLDQQAKDIKRNNLIINIILKHPERTFLVLVKRVFQGEYLMEKLKQFEIKTDCLFGTKQTFDKKCNVLIGTSSKIGTGFDFDKLDTLLLAADVLEYYIQFLGRIFRKPDTVPIIFDLIDDNQTLQKHFNLRSKVYKDHGGEIYTYNF